MSKLACWIRIGEVPLHLYQLTAGFIMLKKLGIIDLQIEKLTENDSRRLPYNMMEVILNGKTRILYDLNDGYDNLVDSEHDYIDFMDRILADYDLCFKRSFSKKYNAKLKQCNKIFPLGLNYMVTVPGNFSHIPTRCDPQKERIKKFIRMLPFSEYYNGFYYVNAFESPPNREKDPKILFMARLWDINGDNGNEIPSYKKEERKYINEVRAKCIRLCRKEFGERFYGGISASKYADKYYPDLVITDKKMTKRNEYLRKMKESSICVATMGLHESIGWKFAEYIAASKAIVTEKLHYDLPGDFRENENFLAFQTPEECIEQLYKLLNNGDFRFQMMVKNFQYYHQHVRPDRLVLNSLIAALNGGDINATNANRLYAYI